MSLNVERLQKRPSWSRVYEFDFRPFAEVGIGEETLSNPVVTVQPGSGLQVGTPLVVDGTVQVRLSAGAAGVVYRLICTVQTSGGNVLSVEGDLRVEV